MEGRIYRCRALRPQGSYFLGVKEVYGDSLVRSFLAKIQGGLSVGIAILLVFAWKAGEWIQQVNPTAGTYDPAVFQGMLIGAVAFLAAVWLAWLVLQLEWPTLNKYIDFSQWSQDWRVLRPEHRIWYLLAVWVALFGGAITCLLAWR